MKKVLISIHPRWCAEIFNGQKTIEVRKSFPRQLETPFEVLVYQTKIRFKVRDWQENFQSIIFTPNGGVEEGNGKVIGSFVCDKVYKIVPDGEYYSNGYDIDDDMLSETCLGRGYLTGYGLGYTLYGWHITEPKLFDKPRELKEFKIFCKQKIYGGCPLCGCSDMKFDEQVSRIYYACNRPSISNPPQSWRYVDVDE